MIRDQTVEKCASNDLRQKLSQKDDLDLRKTIKIARSDETSKQDATLIAKGIKENPILVVQIHTRKSDGTRDGMNSICYRCGGMDGHSPDECGAIYSRDNRKMGHLARVCKSTKKPQRCSNRNSNQKASKNPKRADKNVRNLRAERINEETSSDNKIAQSK